MSLIYGLCLPRKIYLVSDSRLTTRHSDGSITHSDDFGKWLDIVPKVAVVVANSAHQASWMLQKMLPEIREKGMEWDFGDVERYLKANLKRVATEYYTETGFTSNSVSFIFGGFDHSKKLKIESSRMGNAMSAPIMRAGEGHTFTQTVDMDIINAFSKVLHEGPVEAGTMFEVDLPRPRVLAVTVRAIHTGTEIIYEDAYCYEGIVFNPSYKTERIEVPSELIGDLEYRNTNPGSSEKAIYQDCSHILMYTDALIDEKGWPTVGGEVLPLLVLPDTNGFATGQHVRIKDGKRYVGGVGADEAGRMFYYNREGGTTPYRFIYDYLDSVIEDDGAQL